jgi:hypothetical protein
MEELGQVFAICLGAKVFLLKGKSKLLIMA